VTSTESCAFADVTKIGVILQLQTVVYDRLLIPRGYNIALRFMRIVLQPHDSLDSAYYQMLRPETLSYMAYDTGLGVS